MKQLYPNYFTDHSTVSLVPRGDTRARKSRYLRKTIVGAIGAIALVFGPGVFFTSSEATAQITALSFDDRSGPDDAAIQDNSVAGKYLGMIDVTGGAAPYTYSLVAGEGDTNNSMFFMSGDSLYAAQFIDFETMTSPLSIRVQANDFAQAISIGINDVDETTAGSFGGPFDEYQINPPTSSSTQSVPVVGKSADGAYVVVWQDQSDGIEAILYGANGIPTDTLRVDNPSNNNQISPSVAMASDGSFVVVWQGSGNVGAGTGNDIVGRMYAADGTAGTEFTVNTNTAGEQINPHVDMTANGGFAVTWQGEGGADVDGVYARLFDAEGNAVTGQFPVNTTTANAQENPSVGIDDNGNFVVAWESVTTLDINDAPSASNIYMQLYDNAGAAVGSEVQVNTEGTGLQGAPDVDKNGSGAFVVVWQGDGADDANGIYGRRFDAAGAAVDAAQFIVNTAIASDEIVDNQFSPNVAIASDGSFVVVYTGQGSSNEIFAQRFDNTGARIEGFEVNRFRLGTQRFGDVAVDGEGGFIVVWEELGNGNEIYARQYYYNEAPTAVALDDSTVPNGSAAGVVIGNFTTQDPDPADRFAYALVSGEGDTDNGAFAIEDGQLVTAAPVDQATQPTYSIRVRSTDALGLFVESTIAVEVGEGSANQVPVVAANTGLNVTIGDTVMLTQAALEVTDAESAPEAVTYTLVTIPANGTLQLSESPLAVDGTFTQADINGGLVMYVHDSTETTTDSFSFIATDEAMGATAETTVSITISTAGTPVANAGDDQVVTDEDNNGDAEVTLDGSASSDDGSIASYVWNENDAEIATGVNPTVTLTVGEHVIALVVTDDGGLTASDTVVVTVNAPVADNTLPVVATNAGLSVAQPGDTVAITPTELETTDAESGADAITYTLTQAPTSGTLQRDGADLAVDGTFTQQDIVDGLIRYVNNEDSEANDAFSFTVADADGGAVAETQFAITITLGETVTALGDEIDGEIVVVYPNPSQQTLFIKMSRQMRTGVKVNISNNVGQLVKSVQLKAREVSQHPIDISTLSPGTYFVRINAGNQSVIKKLIKE